MTDWKKRLAIISDEADDSFRDAVQFCLPLGIRNYEIRKLGGGRFPDVSDEAIQEVIDTVAEYDLNLIGVSPGFFKHDLAEATTERTFHDGLPRAITLMHKLGMTRMTLFTFKRGSDPNAPIPGQIYDYLGRAIEICRGEGIEVLLENAASIWSNTGANLATIAATLGLRVVWDPANAAASGELAYPDGYAEVRDLIAHVHFKNWTRADGFVAINEGVADLTGQVAALKADGYDGHFCLEPHQWADRHNAVRANTAQLLNLLQPLGGGEKVCRDHTK
ncbi:MAG: TIM barrel protein [Chloroflexi bacterium]|nr:TIM barrel protein [Chloroflexota bacterium]